VSAGKNLCLCTPTTRAALRDWLPTNLYFTNPPSFVSRMSNKGERIQQVLEVWKNQIFGSISQSAALHSVLRSTLDHRNRVTHLSTVDRSQQRLANKQEQVLIQWIKDLQRQYTSPNYVCREM
jgi:hypothetical protein